ncbi:MULTISPECIES: hypothetical protein [Moorena]|uniref:Uncharacterized protein n=1 Tax=Moorena producens 3L TaxID=489825 RepID=F4XXX5_9CYAN|nr:MULTISPECIES: hypothetical protein [Moorena]NEQ17919.1 hypothetical protein [Moorena sp. SIO3E2]EGJ30544.1 hypothetical protein LYNGBM3L_49620 [Moorena producens 3L]NEP64935.1 hypothetical protein [Moorena sp. SIO3A5]NER92045.1 hypothetical protein [Moorena sp. SIO3A2]NES43263.1 hypothetical protein [Moorena sp. SIO2C4]
MGSDGTLLILFATLLFRSGTPLSWSGSIADRDQLVGQMFESESELAYHVTVGLEARGERNGHQVDYVNLRGVK